MEKETIKVYFRLDDVANSNQDIKNIISYFLENRLPICLQIIPASINSILVDYINTLKNNPEFNNLICICQHGYNHNNYSGAPYDTYEFGKGRSYQEQYNDIYTGFQIMKSRFKEHFFKAFSPPFNSFNGNTLKVCEELNFEVFSQEQITYYNSYNFIDISPQINFLERYKPLKFTPIDELCYTFDKLYYPSSIIGFLLHISQSKILIRNLETIVKYIKSHNNIEFVTFKDISRVL